MSQTRTLLALGSLVLLLGCQKAQTPAEERRSTPFVFQRLNLQQQDAQGRQLWRVSSPEARYDLARRLAQARNLLGEINVNGQPLYRLQASHGTVLSDGEVLQLEGEVQVQRLGADAITIRATRMRWYPRQQRIELDRGAEASDPDLRLTANKATLLLDRDLLQLRGAPALQARQLLNGQPGLRLQLQQLDWSPGSGALVAPGPAVAVSAAADGSKRTLRAAGLAGNSLARSLQLLGPVRLEAPDQNAWLQAQTSTADLRSNTISSPAAFTAAIGPLQIAGGGLRLALRQNTAAIHSGCRLKQPDAALTAQACQWNWQNSAINANGNVVLQRQANRQTTRAQALRGRMGAQGLLVFSAPGSRVRSTLVLPQGRSSPGTKATAIRL